MLNWTANVEENMGYQLLMKQLRKEEKTLLFSSNTTKTVEAVIKRLREALTQGIIGNVSSTPNEQRAERSNNQSSFRNKLAKRSQIRSK